MPSVCVIYFTLPYVSRHIASVSVAHTRGYMPSIHYGNPSALQLGIFPIVQHPFLIFGVISTATTLLLLLTYLLLVLSSMEFNTEQYIKQGVSS